MVGRALVRRLAAPWNRRRLTALLSRYVAGLGRAAGVLEKLLAVRIRLTALRDVFDDALTVIARGLLARLKVELVHTVDRRDAFWSEVDLLFGTLNVFRPGVGGLNNLRRLLGIGRRSVWLGRLRAGVRAPR